MLSRSRTGVNRDGFGNGVAAQALGRCSFRERGQSNEPGFRHVRRQADRDAGALGRFKIGVVPIAEGRLGAANARVAALDAGAFAVPSPDIAVAVHLRTDAAEMLHHATELADLLGARLIFVEFVTRAAMMDEVARIKARPAERIEACSIEPSVANLH